MSDGELASGAERTTRASAEATAKPGRRSGSGVAAIATLLSLLALGASIYPYYRHATGGVAPDGVSAFDSLRAEQQRQAAELRSLLDRGSAERSDAAARPNEPVSAATLSAEARRGLQLAQAEWLLREAKVRLLAEKDPHAALALVLSAQSIVDVIDDASLGTARATLTQQVAALRGAADLDVNDVFRRLQALIGILPDLPARGVRFGTETEPVAAQSASVWSVAWQKFRSLFEFRRQGAAERPPLGPDAAAYLRLNLGLMLQSAQLAVIRRDATVYEQSLNTARRWLDDRLDIGAPAVADARAELDRLASVQLDRPLPDLSDSLDAVRATLNARADQLLAVPAVAPAVQQFDNVASEPPTADDAR